ncbi:MFS transporter [Saccharopolyspora sp. NPDC049426]|uniref:MFS transporter n=1 Tax=Saccharopolyspora sp. NPDC049426 TaxID=3155652 RepID=UPI0034241938
MEFRSRTPALLALALAYFAVVAAAPMVVGISAPIAGELDVGEPAVGMLVTLFTLVFGLGSPIVAMLVGVVNRRSVLLIGLGLMVLGGVGSAVAPNFAFLAAARVVTGLGAAAFIPREEDPRFPDVELPAPARLEGSL